MYNYIYSEQEVLLNIISGFNYEFKESFKRLFIVGCGSSFNAGKIVEPFIIDYGLTVTVMHPVEFITTQHNLHKDDMVIFISQVGNSALVVNALKRVKGRCITLGLTSNDQGTISEESDYHININCGEENFNSKSKGVSATVLNLLLFIMNYGRANGYISEERFSADIKELKAILVNLRFYTSELEGAIKPMISDIEEDNILWILASSNNYSVSREFAMKVIECSYLKANYKELEEFLHGFEMSIDEKDVMIMLAFDEHSRILAKGIKRFLEEEKIANKVYIVSNQDCDIKSSVSDSRYSIFVSLVLLQLASYYLGVKFGRNFRVARYGNINKYVVTKF